MTVATKTRADDNQKMHARTHARTCALPRPLGSLCYAALCETHTRTHQLATQRCTHTRTYTPACYTKMRIYTRTHQFATQRCTYTHTHALVLGRLFPVSLCYAALCDTHKRTQQFATQTCTYTRTHSCLAACLQAAFAMPEFTRYVVYRNVDTSSTHTISFKVFGKPWFHVIPQSGNLRNCVFMSFSFPAPARREAWGLPAFGVT